MAERVLNGMNDRTCIVTRQTQPAAGLLRFVVGPDMSVVPDLKRNLPGRGCWVTAEKAYVERAAAKNLFSRALKTQVKVPPDLAIMVDKLLERAALGALGLARKAGAVALGAAKVEASVRSGKALAVLHAPEAAEDGVRKLAQARRALMLAGGPEVAAYKLFPAAELGLALGGANVIHAAVLAAEAGKAALKRVVALDRYRGGSPADRLTVAATPGDHGAAKDTE